MGKAEFDPNDPDAEKQIAAIAFLAQQLESDTVVLSYPGSTRVYVGTNHQFEHPRFVTQNK